MGNRKEWKNSRRLFYEFMNPRAVTKFDGYQRKHARIFLSHLAETPQEFINHAKL